MGSDCNHLLNSERWPFLKGFHLISLTIAPELCHALLSESSYSHLRYLGGVSIVRVRCSVWPICVHIYRSRYPGLETSHSRVASQSFACELVRDVSGRSSRVHKSSSQEDEEEQEEGV